MTRPEPHHDTDTGTDGSGEPDGTVVPFHRPGRPHDTTIRVERIETEPMTAEEYRRAVIALAALINEWKHQENPPDTREKTA